ncbi:MAG: radical SAM protein [Proteobacteria bacterium]|nr:radical SAM protein [Pseudomonadota bacterium]
MARKTEKARGRSAASEIGTIRKDWQGRIKVALVYPNSYHVGMSNLGFQTVYGQLNAIEHVVCERSFLPDDSDPQTGRLTTLESGRPCSDFDIIAFSVSFENDFPHLLTILEKAGLPLRSSDRGSPHPLVIAGGVSFFSNPEPVAAFIDCFLIGESENLLPRFFDTVSFDLLTGDRNSCLKTLAASVPGVYVSALYRTTYNPDGTLQAFDPLADVPSTIERQYVKDISATATCSTILTADTSFDRKFLIEVSRGCPHGCRFCSTGFIYRPPRFRPLELLDQCLTTGGSMCDQIGLVGAAISDLPDIDKLCTRTLQTDTQLSFSSLRADAFTPELLGVLSQSKVKTATIAPDAGSERMRTVINKGITTEDILNAAETLVANGIPNLKLYFMIGLPTETMEDVDAIVELCKQIKHRFLKSSRTRKRIGEITVSLSSFVPKPHTPFQWAAMDDVRTLKAKIKRVKNGLKRTANVRVHADIPRWAYIQGLFSRGDRKVSQILLLAHQLQGNWPQTFKATPLNPDFYVCRERPLEELLPWDFIDQGLYKSFLAREYKRALEGKPSPPCPMDDCTVCGVCR